MNRIEYIKMERIFPTQHQMGFNQRIFITTTRHPFPKQQPE